MANDKSHQKLDQILLELTTKKQGILRKTVPGSDHWIDDPVRHADRWYGGGYRITERTDLWRMESEYHTTGEFSRVRARFELHCGPTAITNLLLAASNRRGNNWIRHRSPADLFEVVASEGMRMMVYHSGSWHNLFGGTSDLMVGQYIRRSAQAVGMNDLQVGPPVPAVPRYLEQWLKAGNLAFLMLHRHECYRNHHVLCNGTVLVENELGRKHRYYQIMDGWAGRPRFVDEESLKGDFFWKISFRND